MTPQIIKSPFQKTELIEVLENITTYQPNLIKTLKEFDLLHTTRNEIHLFDNSDDVNGVTPVVPRFHAHIFESTESQLMLKDNEINISGNPEDNYITEVTFDKNDYITALKVSQSIVKRLRRNFDSSNDNGLLSCGRFDLLASVVKDLNSSLSDANEVFKVGNGVRAIGSSKEISKILQKFKIQKCLEIKGSN
jgi:hypothetical protein